MTRLAEKIYRSGAWERVELYEIEKFGSERRF